VIQVGQVLDKYELLERVGQGGMAIVYRGLDRSLKRTVAVKILHKHLADYQEARDRFEREAQAVAKLRHENILEIFDYSAKADSESYIVTEFIDGQTLKQFFTERPITYPEVGAMIMLQVARALAHAHAGGILHRDVKPENIMIRSDGVVKLMDFGISHMVDLERLTVTGQLLGSPAYMAPEHVEGRPLDFRTDVFAVGIVLYQLTVGKLPFEGKNPHEVLKRIAECKFVDPRQANPRIGNRLGRIILKAMAAQPNDRYPAIGEMVLALEAYLEESGLPTDKITSELARYFKAPAAYEQALKERLIDHLTRRGQKRLADGEQAPALDIFDRVLTIDPNNEKVLAILDGLNRRARLKNVGIAALAILVIGGGAFAIHQKNKPPEPQPPPDPNPIVATNLGGPNTNVTNVEPAPVDIDAGIDPSAQIDGGPTNGGSGTVVIRPPNGSNSPPTIDAGPTEPLSVEVPVRVMVADAEWRTLPDGDWHKATGNTFAVKVSAPTQIEIKHECCQAESLTVTPDMKEPQRVTMKFKAASIRPLCKVAGASVAIDYTYNKQKRHGNPDLGSDFNVTFESDATTSTKSVTVVFTDSAQGRTDEQHVTVNAGQPLEVACQFAP
jgi:eukaryotic-like serine/threonine-protein kinase